MLFPRNRISRFILLISITAAASLAVSFLVSPPDVTQEWLIVFSTLLILSFVSEILALKVTARGAETSMDFVPQLAAVLLIGPAGAGFLTAISWSIYQVALTDKPLHKAVFNVSQFVLSVSAAGLVFIGLGGTPSLHSFDFSSALFPFTVAVVAYFAINSTAVSYVISISEDKGLQTVWQELSLTPLAFDFLISSLALLVTYLYISWNAVAMLAAVVPIIGLRYSYGVNLELKQLNSDLLRALINTIEAQDPYTSGHSIRVAEGALEIADQIGLGPQKRRWIETAALLHDIGKIDSSFHKILRKEDDLTEEDWELIRRHPNRGAELIQPIRSMDQEVLDYIRHHHERYDGNGYPAGLEGEQIPLGARVIMVSDTIDAMVTERPYRSRIDPDDVRDELQDKAGRQFDPELVKAALQINLPQKMYRAADEKKEISSIEQKGV